MKKGRGVGILFLVGNFFHELFNFDSSFDIFLALNYYSTIDIIYSCNFPVKNLKSDNKYNGS